MKASSGSGLWPRVSSRMIQTLPARVRVMLVVPRRSRTIATTTLLVNTVKKLFLVLLIPALLLAGLEGVLALLYVAPVPPTFLRVERDGRPLYCANQKSSFWSEPFIETCVAPEKDPGTFRIFVIGESTPNGFPF